MSKIYTLFCLVQIKSGQQIHNTDENGEHVLTDLNVAVYLDRSLPRPETEGGCLSPMDKNTMGDNEFLECRVVVSDILYNYEPNPRPLVTPVQGLDDCIDHVS